MVILCLPKYPMRKYSKLQKLMTLSKWLMDTLITLPVLSQFQSDQPMQREVSVFYFIDRFQTMTKRIKRILNTLHGRINGPPIDKFVCYKFVRGWKKWASSIWCSETSKIRTKQRFYWKQWSWWKLSKRNRFLSIESFFRTTRNNISPI